MVKATNDGKQLIRSVARKVAALRDYVYETEVRKFKRGERRPIFFYIGTFEPILQLFRDDAQVKSEEAQKLVVPESMEKLVKSSFFHLDEDIAIIDRQVDRLNNDPDNSVEMARAALDMYNATVKMEEGRQRLFEALCAARKNGEKNTVAL